MSSRNRLVVVLAGLAAAGAILAWIPGSASASSYSGSGDWVIAANVTETVVSETINISGNLTVGGTLNVIASALVIDRNVTVSGVLRLWATSVTLTADGPGTNYIDVRAGATFDLRDLDGNPATAADAGVLRTDAFAFHGTVGQNATLEIVNSRVTNAGWPAAQPSVAGAGFSVQDGHVLFSFATFVNGWEVLLARGSTNLTVVNTVFDGAVVAVNVSGGSGQRFSTVTLVNHTYGILLTNTRDTNITGLTVNVPRLATYRPPGSGPAGSGLDALGCMNLTLDGLAIQGLPAPAGTMAHTGFQIRNATLVTIAQVSAVWAGSVGSITGSSDIVVREAVVAQSIGPLAVADSNRVSILNLTAQLGDSGVGLSNVSSWRVDGVAAVGLSGGAIVGVALTGDGTLANITVEDGPLLAALAWAGPGNAVVTNATALTLGAGIAIRGQSTLSVVMDGLYAWTMTAESLLVDVHRLERALIANVTVNVTEGVAISLNGSEMSNGSVGPVTVLQGADAAMLVGFTWVNGTSFHDLEADNITGPMLLVSAAGGLDGSSFSRLKATNTTGVVLQVAAALVGGVTVSDIHVVDGIVVPAGAEAAVAVVAGRVVGSDFTSVLLERSLVGAVNVSAGSLSQFNVTGVRGDTVSAPAVSVDCQGQLCTVTVSQVALTRSLDIAVLLTRTRGQVRVSDVATDSPWGVWGDRAQDVTIEALNHNGTASAVALVDCARVSLANATLRGGVGLATERGSAISMADSISYTDGPTVESRGTANLTVSRITFVDAGAAVRLLGTVGTTVEDLVGSVLGYVLYASQDASTVVLRRVQMGTASGATAGVVITATRASGVAISDYNFTGPCNRSGFFQLVAGLDITRLRSDGCDDGIEIYQAQGVNLTAVTVRDVVRGIALSVSESTRVRVAGAELQRAGGQALSLGGGGDIEMRDVNGSDSRGDGALLFFAKDAWIRDSVFDRAAAASLFFFFAGPNLTVSNVTARGSLLGADLLSSRGVVLDGVDLSDNRDFGLASDAQSSGNTLRNLTVRRNGPGGGIIIGANGTLLIDGNFSDNRASAIRAEPFIRLDWRVARSASLVDDGVNLTGDLTVEPGATFTLRRARLTIDQAARQAAFQPIAVINVSAGALFVIEDGTVSPRDAAAPYAILLSDGGRALWGNATVRGGNVTSPLSAIRLRSAVADLVGGEVSRWHLPLEATDSVVTVDGTRFADSWTGPRLSGGTARLANVTSQSNAGDGFGATAVTSLHLTAFSAFNNGGAGARLDAVVFAALAGYDARANGAAGLRAEGTHVEAQGLSLVGNAEEGLALVGSSYARIEAVEANSNLRSGVSLADVASFEIRGLTAHGNGGSGLVVAGASRGTVTGASIRQNSAFAVHATGGVSLTVTGADLADDVLGALRLEGSVEVSLRAASISSPADYAIAAIDDVNLTMTDVVSTAVVAVLIASDNAQVLAINCSIGSPIVVSQAVVRIGWHVRVVVQDASGGPGAGVAVTVRDAGGAAVANGTTGPSGVLPLMAVVERAHYGDGTRLTYGPHTIVAQSAALGRARVTENVSRFLTVGLRLDALPPTLDVEFSSTSGVTGWFLGPVGITLRAFDDRADGVTMSYRVLGGPWLDAASNTSGATVTIEVEAEGVTLIEVLLRDHAGNERGPETVEVRVDLAAPSGSFGPADAVYFVPSFVPSWSGTDGRGSGVANYRVEYAVNNGPYVMFLNGTTLRQAAFSATDADYRFRLTVFDVAGRASPPAYIDVSFALLGAFRVRVLDASGAAISNTSVLVEDLNVSLSGEGDLEITGLPAGAHTIVVSAPGHGAVRMEVNITARQTVDLGEVVLRPEAGGMPTELVVLWGLLAGVGAATIGYWVYLRQKWTRPRGPKKEEP